MPPSPRFGVPTALVVLVAIGAFACGGPQPAAKPENLVLVVVDTLRADHLGLYGYHRPTSPHLDALGERSAVFDTVRSQAPCTYPSVNVLLTSRAPATFLGQGDRRWGIPAEVPTLAETLRSAGFATAAVSASTVVRRTPSYHNRYGGFGAGFDRFHESCMEKGAGCVARAADEALRELPEPFFLYLHYLDPHSPYDPVSPYRERFLREEPARRWVRRGEAHRLAAAVYGDAGAAKGFDRTDLAALVDLYDGEIAAWDDHLPMLLDALRKRGALDRTLLVVTADHGESFLEHGDVLHCRSLYEPEVRVPLVVHGPGIGAARIDSPVALIDVAPTVLDVLGVRGPDGMQGRSLAPLLAGRSGGTAPPAFALIGSLRSAADERAKLVRDLVRGEASCLDTADPRERPLPPAACRELGTALEAWLAEHEDGGRAEASQEAMDQLRAVGYLQ